jgi:hypothetical protein
MNQVFLIKDIKRFQQEILLTPDDKDLGMKFGYDEWLEILLNVFDIDKNLDEPVREKIKARKGFLSLTNELPGFPLFSRIQGVTRDAVFQEHEIHLLKEECDRIKHFTTNSKAFNGIGKLLKICDAAESHRLNIYFLGA